MGHGKWSSKDLYICMYAWARAQSQTGKKEEEEIDKQLDRYPLTPDKVLYLQIPHKGPPQDPQLLPSKKKFHAPPTSSSFISS